MDRRSFLKFSGAAAAALTAPAIPQASDGVVLKSIPHPTRLIVPAALADDAFSILQSNLEELR